MITVTKDLEGRTVSTDGAVADVMNWISRKNHFKLSSLFVFKYKYTYYQNYNYHSGMTAL